MMPTRDSLQAIRSSNQKIRKTTNTQTLNNMVLNNQWVNEETKKAIKKIPRQRIMAIQCFKIFGTQKKQF